MKRIAETLSQLRAEGNFRSIPREVSAGVVDFTSNDYLGIASRPEFQAEFFASDASRLIPLTSSASRLLSGEQDHYEVLETKLERLYGKPALIFNSGYHANVGLISALVDKDTLILADKLVHASIIDGYKMTDATMVRFRHNDMKHLEMLLASRASKFARVLIVVESVYSMDGDSPDLSALVRLKEAYPNSLLYVDEAHAFGAVGRQGLGLCKEQGVVEKVDVIVGTLGKAAASSGAFAVMSPMIKDYAINAARSFIFSTALPPICCAYTSFLIDKIVLMDEERAHLAELGRLLAEKLQPLTPVELTPSHIIPFIVGSSQKALSLSRALLDRGVKVLPIRKPTVPAGTERLRISLSASMTHEDIDKLSDSLTQLI